MLVDNILLIVKAGNGGNGAVSFLRNGQKSRGGPDGGNGGNGGNIYLQGTHNLTDLREFRFKKKIKAEDGIPGDRKNLYGKNAPHATIYLPYGTQVTNKDTNESFEITNDDPVLIARGGIGGRGNNEFKSATNQAPKYAETGGIGEEKKLLLELKFIAEVGLVGLPNSGKSSLLAVLTNAQPKIGNFAFTTLEPNIGMMPARQSPDGSSRMAGGPARHGKQGIAGGGKHMIADIPGLIEGASEGKGLGIKFLKHIEKTKLLIHCIDAEEEKPEKIYETVRIEFGKYNPLLLEKPEIILITKKDLISEEMLGKRIKALSKKGRKVLTSSIYDENSLKSLKNAIETVLV